MILENLSIEVKVDGGADITAVCREAVSLANHMRLPVWFDFNGVHTLARVGDDPDKVEEAWRKELASSRSIKVAATHA